MGEFEIDDRTLAAVRESMLRDLARLDELEGGMAAIHLALAIDFLDGLAK